MDIDRYQDFTKTTAIYPKEEEDAYLLAGLMEEVGELAGARKKYLRGDYPIEDFYERVRGELGDVLWYYTRICDSMGYYVSDIIDYNVEKLTSRKERNKLKGDGDNR